MKAVYFVRFAMFEVAITKKSGDKADKTSPLWQRTTFTPTSNDLNVIVCDSKAVKWSFYSNYPNTIKQEIHVHIPCGWCVTEADWLIAGHSISEDQWNCILQIRGAVTQRWRQSCSSQLGWWFLETITVVIIFLKHSWWLTVYREMSEYIFAKNNQTG